MRAMKNHEEATHGFPACPTKGYFAALSYLREGDFEHWLGGSHSSSQCPNCQWKPLLQLMSLDLRDPRLELESAGLERLPLLFCWTCGQHKITYSLNSAGECKLLEFQKTEPVGDFPYRRNYPVAFEPTLFLAVDSDSAGCRACDPEKAAINDGSEDEWGELGSYLKLDYPRHQIGGLPYLVQHNTEDRHLCAGCGKLAPFLATVSDEAGYKMQFVRNSFVQVVAHFCSTCRVVIAYQQCD